MQETRRLELATFNCGHVFSCMTTRDSKVSEAESDVLMFLRECTLLGGKEIRGNGEYSKDDSLMPQGHYRSYV